MAQSSEQRELDLVGKVELRLALAENEVKLQSTLQTYLPPLLLKLASPYLNVRNKVSLVLGEGRSNSSAAHLLSDSLSLWLTIGFARQVISICQHVNSRINFPYEQYFNFRC